MAARNPSAFVEWISERDLLEGKKILDTNPDEVFTDQVQLLDTEVQVVSDAFNPFRVTSTSYVEVARYHIRAKDGCLSSSNDTSHKVTARVWLDASHSVTIRVDSTQASDSTFVSYTNSGAAAEFDLNVGTLDCRDNTEETLTVKMKTSSGHDPEIFAIHVFGEQT